MKEPGFLRCAVTTTVDGRDYRSVGTAAYAPERIEPAGENPPDFDAFWAAAKEALAKLPIDARLTPKPELSTGAVDVYHVSLQNVGYDARGTSRFYGILAVPKAEGRFPAVMNPPGAGARPYRGQVDLASRGYITLQVGIHGIPVDLPQEVYDGLLAGAAAGDEVVQVYLGDREASVRVARWKLVGFARVALAPGEAKTVSFSIAARSMAVVDGRGRHVVEPGRFQLHIGGRQPDARSAALAGTPVVTVEFEAKGKPVELAW